MVFDDNRQFIQALERTGDVVRIKQEVDWDIEVGSIIRRTNELKGPAVLFEKLKDYPPGYRIFGSPLGTHRRLAIAMGLQPDAHPKGIQNEFESRIQDTIKPVVTSEAPCQENVLLGEDVDLYRFPAPMVHYGDGGRFMGTWHLVVTKDPDSDWVNWGIYRMMIFNKNHIGVHLTLGNDGGKIFLRKYAPKKEPMPVAVAIGADPLSSMMGCAYVGRGRSEADFAGGLRGRPVELVKCRTNDLLVPAHAEVVLEGEVLPYFTFEGPFGEFPGYRSGLSLHPVMRVEAITYRHAPILTMTCVGIPVDDGDICQNMAAAVGLKKRLREHGVPVADVHVPPEGASHLAVVSLKVPGNQVMDQVADFGFVPALGEVKIMLVNEDIDIYDLDQVCHAFATKCHPARGIKVVEHPYAVPLTPFLSHAERAAGKGCRVIFDCTWPSEWSLDEDIPPRSSFNDMYPPEIRERILWNWQNYGFKNIREE